MIKYVSFDVYDTAIIRLVKRPTDVFSYVEAALDKAFCINTAFKLKRIQAEKDARIKKGDKEVTLGDIYEYVDIEEISKEELMSYELHFEEILCRSNQEIKKQYDLYLSKGYKIIFTSDMYLSRKEIERLLVKCGYEEFDEIYVSSEVGETKKSGGLFKYILDREKIKKRELLHIGNNLKSDYIRPLLLGINAKYYKYIEKASGDNLISNYISKVRLYGAQICPEDNIGYSVVGPFALGFVDWIRSKCAKKEKIFFLSRDGYLFYKFYSFLFDDGKARYLRVSRRSLRNAILSLDLSFDDFCKIIPPFKTYTFEMFIDLLNLNLDEVEHISSRRGADSKAIVCYEDIVYDSFFNELYNFALQKNGKQYINQRELLKEYLRQESFKGKLGIVDLSFKGTSFFLLKKFCEHEGIDVELDGYVLGKSGQMQQRIGEVSRMIHGWLFESENDNPVAKLLISNATVYERFFFDEAGTTLAYTSDNGIINPILAENKESNNLDVIKKIRNGAEKFAENIKSLYLFWNVPIDRSVTTEPMIQFLIYPSGGYVDLIGDLVEDNVINRYVAKPCSKKMKYVNPIFLLKELKKSFWKQGFLYRVIRTRGVLFIYNRIYMLAKKITLKSQRSFFEGKYERFY